MSVSKKIKMAAAAGALAGAALFSQAGIAQAQPQGLIGGEETILINPSPEDILVFSQFGSTEQRPDGSYVFRLPPGSSAQGVTWFQVIQENSSEFAAIGVSPTPPPPYST